MAKISKEQWVAIRAKREATGATFQALANEYGVTHQAIAKKAKAEYWGDGLDVRAELKRQVALKLAKVEPTYTQDRLEGALDEESDRITAVQLRHREDINSAWAWAVQTRIAYRKLKSIKSKNMTVDELKAAINDKNMIIEDIKAAKMHADTLKVLQECDRKAWNLDEVNIDVSKMTDEQMDYIWRTGKLPPK